VVLDEARELRRALALGVVAHPRPELDVRLRQRGLHRLGVRERDEPVAFAPERGDRAVESDRAVVEAAGGAPGG
jgi:hypothetical protein